MWISYPCILHLLLMLVIMNGVYGVKKASTYVLPASWSSTWPSRPPAAADWWLHSEVSPSGCCCWSQEYGRLHGSHQSCKQHQNTEKYTLRVQQLKNHTWQDFKEDWNWVNSLQGNTNILIHKIEMRIISVGKEVKTQLMMRKIIIFKQQRATLSTSSGILSLSCLSRFHSIFHSSSHWCYF